MAAVPQAFPMRSTDFPDGISSSEDFQRFAAQLNTFMRQCQSLGQAVNAVQNLDGIVTAFNVTMPTTDVSVPALLNGWVAFSAAETPWVRTDSAGNVWVFGRVRTGTAGTQVFAWPASVTGPTESPMFATAPAAVIQWTPAGVTHVSGANTDISLNTAFPSALRGPGVYPTVWPQQVKLTKGRVPLGCLLLGVNDTVQTNTTPDDLATGISWTYQQSQAGSPNLLRIDNVPGLSLGRSYSVTLLVLYAPN